MAHACHDTQLLPGRTCMSAPSLPFKQHSLKSNLNVIMDLVLKENMANNDTFFIFFLHCCHFQSMASTISLLPEKHFLCSLCKDIFTSPVTIPCGHSFCLSCLCQYWARHQSKYCPDCKRVFTDKPVLSVNHILADVSDNYKKTRPEKPPDKEMVPYYVCLLSRQR